MAILGRFLSVDPIVGGNETSNNYPNDSVNQNDLTGHHPATTIQRGIGIGIGQLAECLVSLLHFSNRATLLNDYSTTNVFQVSSISYMAAATVPALASPCSWWESRLM